MARRRASAEGANLDSLMDTLTNVVGILIMILILVQINAVRSVKKIVSDLPPVSLAELEKKKQELAEAKSLAEAELQKLERRKKAPPMSPTEVKKLAAEIIQLERDIQSRRGPLLDLETLQKKLAEQEKVLVLRKDEMAALLKERESLLGILQATPVPVAPQPKVVRVPNSRPVPENANYQRFLVANGRVYHLDADAAVKQVMDDFARVKRDMEKERIKRDGKLVIIYDQEKMVNYFATRKPNLRDVEATVMPNKPWTRLYVQMKPKSDGGEATEQLAPLTSRYQNLLRSFPGRTVVWFHVVPDSFESYLKARELCDQRGLPAGWEITGPAFNVTLNDVEVNRLVDPPPPGPAPKILPPKRTLD